MSRTIPSASLLESFGFFRAQVLPNVRQGLFKRRPDAVERNIRRGTDREAVAAAGRLRDKYGDLVWVRVPIVFHALLVLGPQGVRHVLDRSPEVYADPPTKRKGMSHFQPHAVTISRGEVWKDRRRFNEAALATHSRLHPHAAKFLAAVREEVDALEKRTPRELVWKDFEDLFERITLRVLFGDGAGDDRALAGHLSSMLEEANERNPRGPSSHFQPFNEGVGRYLKAAAPGSLAESASKVPAGPDTQPAGQFPHWMFAMKDTTTSNTARALALILAHPDVERRVREEIAAADPASPEGVDGLRYLEACVHEAMRLWPTTPLLSREALRDDSIDGATVPKGSQVIIPNTFLHRDGKAFPEADTFSPDRWLAGDGFGARFQHFSSGPQGCAGLHIAVFLAKATIAALLRRRYALLGPALETGRPLPHAYNYFQVRFGVR